ncbi:hypothetical protein AL755_00635 (plasmid) [Arthrobacter sp. ERGS1:01]|uniref:YciI family protein n=1 Tax=Arthrobacter sp. ERGS1:01 TaxID=1704044 RepID=UPI0006B4EE41|nr:YciI family protein [Arthrobacter sp. ERGS1:01]ALE04259.1 hypothetical protein AL755_00635 [Arthrobacter sp. ERGS1:01]
MQYVAFYSPSPTGFGKVAEVYSRHLAYVNEQGALGKIIGIGTFDAPETNGAMCIFTSRAAAEEFLAGDPFVQEGVVDASGIREWDPLTFTGATK